MYTRIQVYSNWIFTSLFEYMIQSEAVSLVEDPKQIETFISGIFGQDSIATIYAGLIAKYVESKRSKDNSKPSTSSAEGGDGNSDRATLEVGLKV